MSFDNFEDGVEESPLTDDFTLKKRSVDDFPPPHKKEGFLHYWNIFLPEVIERENFHKGHLEQLRILCELLEEAEELKSILDLEGFVFESRGRNGRQIKNRPEVAQLSSNRKDILNYCKSLGISLAKATSSPTDPSDGDKW